jgi:flavin reductase (DIM6/NTAB) family NADH-FMN oxidoreductase RutF
LAKTRFMVPRISLFPTAIVVVTSVNNSGDVGAAAIAWNGIVSSRPPMISVSFLPDSFTRSCLLETRDFVVNVPDASFWKEANYLGSLSGSWASKISSAPADLAKLTLAPSTTIRSPRIEEFYLNFECRVLRGVQIGLYDCFLGELMAMHCDTPVFTTTHPKGNIDHQAAQPVLCLGDEYWSGGRFLGLSTENKRHPHGSSH